MSDETKDILFKDLSMRLPHGVKVLHNKMVLPMGAYPSPVKGQIDIETVSEGGFKPILRPLSDLSDDELNQMGYDSDEIKLFIEHLQSGGIFQKHYMYLIENHYDVSLLIERGMAVDVNTLETDPYK